MRDGHARINCRGVEHRCTVIGPGQFVQSRQQSAPGSAADKKLAPGILYQICRAMAFGAGQFGYDGYLGNAVGFMGDAIRRNRALVTLWRARCADGRAKIHYGGRIVRGVVGAGQFCGVDADLVANGIDRCVQSKQPTYHAHNIAIHDRFGPIKPQG